MSALSGTTDITVAASYVEIYLEKIRDLLDRTKQKVCVNPDPREINVTTPRRLTCERLSLSARFRVGSLVVASNPPVGKLFVVPAGALPVPDRP